MGLLEDLYQETEQKMEKSVDSVRRDFASVRTGRASKSILDSVKVEYFGAQMSLNQVANIAVPEARLIEIRPFDKTVIPELEKAILQANLGLTPQSDGKVVRIGFPPLTEERRRELAKVVKKMAEDGRVAIRNQRRDANENAKEFEKEKMISEDEGKASEAVIQKKTDAAIAKVEELLAMKEKEIMEI